MFTREIINGITREGFDGVAIFADGEVYKNKINKNTKVNYSIYNLSNEVLTLKKTTDKFDTTNGVFETKVKRIYIALDRITCIEKE